MKLTNHLFAEQAKQAEAERQILFKKPNQFEEANKKSDGPCRKIGCFERTL